MTHRGEIFPTQGKMERKIPPGAAARFSEDDCTAIAQPLPIPSFSDFAVQCHFYSANVRANFMPFCVQDLAAA
ncbi:hypothetical protein KL938_000428 [Ogataea parapolymorpha]|nr:hypothetical protein KL938_000428 [Ogataea parapolymorpha]